MLPYSGAEPLLAAGTRRRVTSHIVVHCSASAWGDAAEIHRWHLARGWAGIGYHWVILNGHRRTSRYYDASADGVIEAGRAEALVGSHARGYNASSVGVCLVGRAGDAFPSVSAWASLVGLCDELCRAYQLSPEAIIGHRETRSGRHKTCPDFSVRHLRQDVLRRLTLQPGFPYP